MFLEELSVTNVINKCTQEFHVGKKRYEKNQDLNQIPGIPVQTTAHNTPEILQNIISKEQSECQEADTDAKLQHFIAALAKVRFLKLVKIGWHFCMKCYNFTSLPSYMQKPKPVVKRILKELEKELVVTYRWTL